MEPSQSTFKIDQNSLSNKPNNIIKMFAQKNYIKLRSHINQLIGQTIDDTDLKVLNRELLLIDLLECELDISHLDKFDFPDSFNESKRLEAIVDLLITRLHLKESLVLLDKCLKHPEVSDAAKDLLTKHKPNYRQDFYYKFYGYPLMIMQVLIFGLIIVFSLYSLEQALHSYLYFFYYIASFITVIPIFYTNLRMLHNKLYTIEDCYIENHQEGILVSHHGKRYFIDKATELSIYQDENDFSYRPIIRLLPLVPNFTYIRGIDLFTNIQTTLPLYGVANGEEFASIELKESKVFSINMIGVRISQVLDFINEFKTPLRYIGYGITSFSSMCICLFFFSPQTLRDAYKSIVISTESNIFSYLSSSDSLLFISKYQLFEIPQLQFFSVLLSFGILLIYSKRIVYDIAIQILNIPMMKSLLRLPFLKHGIPLIIILLAFEHYYNYPLGMYPFVICIIWIYMIFIQYKYPHDAKNLMATISVFKQDILSNKSSIHIDDKIRYISFEAIGKNRKTSLFYDEKYIVLPVRIFNITIYHHIINRDELNSFNIYSHFGESTIQYDNWKIKTSDSLDTVSQKLTVLGLQSNIVESYESKLHSTTSVQSVTQILLLTTISYILFQEIQVVPAILLGSLIAAALCKVLNIAFRTHWTLLLCFICYQNFLINYSQQDQTRSKELTSFESLQKNFEDIDIELSIAKIKWNNESKSFLISEPTINYEQYENYLRAHNTNTFEHIPPFILHSRPRESTFDIIHWNLFKKNQTFSSQKYPAALQEYCESKGLGVSSDNPNCDLVINYKGFSASDRVSDIVLFGDPILLTNLDTDEVHQGIMDNPIIYPKVKHLSLYHRVLDEYQIDFLADLKSLLELREFPYRYNNCLNKFNSNFVQNYIGFVLKDKTNINPKLLKYMAHVFQSNLSPKYQTNIVFWKNLFQVCPSANAFYKIVSKKWTDQKQKEILHHALSKKIQSPLYLDKNMLGLYNKYMHNPSLSFDEIYDGQSYTNLVYLLALNHPNAFFSPFWKSNSDIASLISNQNVDIQSMVKNKHKTSLHPFALEKLLMHPKVLLTPVKKHVLQKPPISPISKTIFTLKRLQTQVLKDKSAHEAMFNVAVNHLNKTIKDLQLSEPVFFYSMLKHDWTTILDQRGLLIDDTAYNLIRSDLNESLKKNRSLFFRLPKLSHITNYTIDKKHRIKQLSNTRKKHKVATKTNLVKEFSASELPKMAKKEFEKGNYEVAYKNYMLYVSVLHRMQNSKSKWKLIENTLTDTIYPLIKINNLKQAEKHAINIIKTKNSKQLLAFATLCQAQKNIELQEIILLTEYNVSKSFEHLEKFYRSNNLLKRMKLVSNNLSSLDGSKNNLCNLGHHYQGIKIITVQSGSFAEKYGLQIHDVVLQLNNVKIDSNYKYKSSFQSEDTFNNKFEFKVLRDNQIITLKFPSTSPLKKMGFSYNYIRFQFSQSIQDVKDNPNNFSFRQVLAIMPDSPASKIGLQTYDRIYLANNILFANDYLFDLKSQVDKPLTLLINRDNQWLELHGEQFIKNKHVTASNREYFDWEFGIYHTFPKPSWLPPLPR